MGKAALVFGTCARIMRPFNLCPWSQKMGHLRGITKINFFNSPFAEGAFALSHYILSLSLFNNLFDICKMIIFGCTSRIIRHHSFGYESL